MNLICITANCQHMVRDSLPLYDLCLDKLPLFLKTKISFWNLENDSSLKIGNSCFGTLFVDSVQGNNVVFRFSYYYGTEILKECVDKAWGIYYIYHIPIFLQGNKYERIFERMHEKAIFTRRKYDFDGIVDPFSIRIIMKLK